MNEKNEKEDKHIWKNGVKSFVGRKHTIVCDSSTSKTEYLSKSNEINLSFMSFDNSE